MVPGIIWSFMSGFFAKKKTEDMTSILKSKHSYLELHVSLETF